MNAEDFNKTAVRWINHKLILSNCCLHYNDIKAKVHHVRVKFYEPLHTKGKFSVQRLALLIKRNEQLLEAILPAPGNPSYESAKATLTTLIQEAENIIKHFNLTL